MTMWSEAARLARRQHGVVARRQLIALGIPRASIADKARRDGWRRAHRGVFVLPGASSYEQTVMAAVLAVGDHALASHLTAAHLHGIIDLRPPVIDLLVPYEYRSGPIEGVHVTRTRTLRAGDRCLVRGIPATTIPRTIIDAATVLEPPDIRALIIDARQRKRLDLSRVTRRLQHIGPVRNSGQVRQLVRELDPAWVDSVMESDVRELLRGAGVPEPHPTPFRVRVGDRVVAIDIAWPEWKVGIEVDGYGGHSDRTAMDGDHRKQNALVVEGWDMLRVGWDRLHRDPDGFLAEILALLATAM